MSNNEKVVLQPSKIEDLLPPVVELPGWEFDKPFYARLRRVTLLNLIESGNLPNELLAQAHKMITRDQDETFNPVRQSTPEELVHFTRLLHNVARHALIEPTYQELLDNDILLTDLQLSAIFQYCQQGVQALAFFRPESGTNTTDGSDGESVGEGAE